MKRTTRSSNTRSAGVKASAAPARFVFRLFVSGTTPRSTRAIRNLQKICEEHIPGRYELEIVDIYQQPEMAAKAQIIAAPTLIKSLPLPLRRFIGDITESERMLIALGLTPATGVAVP